MESRVSRSLLRPEFLERAYVQPVNIVPNVNNVNNNKQCNEKNTQVNEKQIKVKELTKMIKDHLTRFKTYHFRPVKIDGISCYVVIHKKYKIINFEAINIKCLVNKNGKKSKQQYSLLFVSYKTIEQALNKIENIVATYKIYNGDLVSPNAYKQLKLEEFIIPYSEEQVCSVCCENTMDITTCKHYICFHCREQCVLTNNTNCPVCRCEEIINIYNIDNGLINNTSYPILDYAIEYENDGRVPGNEIIYIEENDIDNESDNDDNEHDDNETIIDLRENEENIENVVIISSDQNEDINEIDNLINTGLHTEIRRHINDAIQLLSSNITLRNREIIEFNNTWASNLYSDASDIEIQDTITNGIVARSPIPCANNELEEGEIIDNDNISYTNNRNIINLVNSENKNIV